MPLIIDIIIIVCHPLLNPASILDKSCIRICQDFVVKIYGLLCSPECVYIIPMPDVRLQEFAEMLFEQVSIKLIRAFV